MLLERDQELELLAEVLAGVDSLGGKVVLLRGEAGIGKSSFVETFTQSHADGAHVLFGSCDDLLTPQPFGPIWDIAREEPSLSEPLKDDDRRATMEALLDLLSRQLRPTIMVIEDTHWVDEATLDTIKYLGRRIARAKGLLLLTYRDGEVDYEHPLRGVIGDLRPQDLVRIRLGRLSPEAVASMVEDTDLDLDAVLALTGGNPLFVTEVLASGVEDVPPSIRDSVLTRAGRLSSGARQILDAASVIPGASERTLIDSIINPPQEDIDECARQGLLRVDDGTMSFHHELTRRAVESALNATDRRHLNEQVLRELRDVADPSRVVHHAREAEDADAIINFAPKAARAAMAIEGHREAVANFRALDPYLDQIVESERAAIVDDWARSEFYSGNVELVDRLDQAIELHRSFGDNVSLARVLTFAVLVYELAGKPEEAKACSVEAIAILETYPPSPDLALALSQRALLTLLRGDGPQAIDFAEQAFSLAESIDDELGIIHSLNTKGYATYIGGDPGGWSQLEEGRRRAEIGGYRFEEVKALNNMTAAAMALREVALAGELAKTACDTARRYELPALEAYARAHRAEVLEWRGDWVAAEDTATEVLGSHPHVEVSAGWVLGRLQTRRGRPEARATLDRTWSLAEVVAEMQNLAPAAAAMAEYLWLTGSEDPQQIARFREVLDQGSRLGFPWPAGELSLWLWKLGELSEAPEGIAEPYRLVIGGKPMAAAEMWAGIGCPYERAVALAHGDRTAQLEALDVFDTLGASAVAAKLRQALRDQGVSVPRGKARTTSAHPAGLTARQAEVLELLDQGLSNAEIADRLFVSPRTVENHVAALLSKLDSSTRDEAVDRARADGLLTTNGATR